VQAGFTGYGRLGYPAERVADDAVNGFLEYHHAGQSVDPYLADQLILPISTSGKPLSYETSSITQHLLTNVWVASQFFGDCFQVEGSEGEAGTVAFQIHSPDGST
jgi:RNA 3'-terminal phosphate cyclase (ATP)